MNCTVLEAKEVLRQSNKKDNVEAIVGQATHSTKYVACFYQTKYQTFLAV